MAPARRRNDPIPCGAGHTHLSRWLAEGRTLFDPQFVDVYIRTLESAFGESLLAPQLFLNEMYLMVDRRVGTGLARPVRQALRSTSVYSEETAWSEPGILADYMKNPRLNAVFLVHPENVMELANRGILPIEDVRAIAQRAGREEKAIYAFERAPGSSRERRRASWASMPGKPARRRPANELKNLSPSRRA